MTEKRGIEETRDIIDFVFSFVEAVGKAKADGEMSWSDARYFIDPVKKLFEAVDDIEEVLPEIEDLTDEEYDELVEYVKGKWNYDEENLDWIVDTAIEAGRGLMMMINMQVHLMRRLKRSQVLLVERSLPLDMIKLR